MKIVAAILAALVLSNMAMAVMLLQRQTESADQLVRLEKSVEKGAKTLNEVSGRVDASERRASEISDDLQRMALHQSAAPAAGSPRGPAAAGPGAARDPQAPSAAPAGEALSEAQKEAVQKEVEKAVQEKMRNGYMPAEVEDPLASMEKELELSPYQKTRIKELMDQSEAEQAKLFLDGFDPTDRDGSKFDFSKLNDAMAIQKKCDESIARELDTNQQAKYAGLKKSGKLNLGWGNSVRIVTSGQPEENQ